MSEPNTFARTAVLATVGQMAGLGRDIDISFGVDDEMASVIAELPNATVTVRIYVHDSQEPYVIECAHWRAGRVVVTAQRHSRPATSEEIAAANLREHREESYRSAIL